MKYTRGTGECSETYEAESVDEFIEMLKAVYRPNEQATDTEPSLKRRADLLSSMYKEVSDLAIGLKERVAALELLYNNVFARLTVLEADADADADADAEFKCVCGACTLPKEIVPLVREWRCPNCGRLHKLD